MERHRERSGAEKERFNEQYPDLMNKGYFTDVDDDTWYFLLCGWYLLYPKTVAYRANQ